MADAVDRKTRLRGRRRVALMVLIAVPVGLLAAACGGTAHDIAPVVAAAADLESRWRELEAARGGAGAAWGGAAGGRVAPRGGGAPAGLPAPGRSRVATPVKPFGGGGGPPPPPPGAD